MLSKVAAYGFLRIVLPLFPQAAADFQEIILLIALASILYGSALAFTQTNARLILGYSSVAQLGFITLGIFALDGASQGGQGAVLQMVNHGLVVAPLFFIIALLAERAGGSDDIREMGGIAFRAPVLAALFLIAALATLAMPGSANFVGEFFILIGLFNTKIVYSIVAFTGVVLASVYMLRMFIRTMHNRLAPAAESRDLTLARRRRDRAARALHPRARALSAAGDDGLRALGQARRWPRASERPAPSRRSPPWGGRRREGPDRGPAHRLAGALAAARAGRRARASC